MDSVCKIYKSYYLQAYIVSKCEHENERKYEDEHEHESRWLIYSYSFLYKRKLSIAIFINFTVAFFLTVFII